VQTERQMSTDKVASQITVALPKHKRLHQRVGHFGREISYSRYSEIIHAQAAQSWLASKAYTTRSRQRQVLKRVGCKSD